MSTALGPGSADTVTPAAIAACTSTKPGSLTVGMPASDSTQQVGVARQLDQLGRAVALVVLVQRDQARTVLDAQRAQQLHRRAGVFGRDHLGVLERLDQPARRVAEVADGRRGEEEHVLILPGCAAPLVAWPR